MAVFVQNGTTFVLIFFSKIFLFVSPFTNEWKKWEIERSAEVYIFFFVYAKGSSSNDKVIITVVKVFLSMSYYQTSSGRKLFAYRPKRFNGFFSFFTKILSFLPFPFLFSVSFLLRPFPLFSFSFLFISKPKVYLE